MKKIWYFAQICLYVVGAIGGFSWSLYNKSYFIALAVVWLAYMAFPKLKDCIYKITH